MCCVLISAKYLERDDMIPSVDRLCKATRWMYNRDMVIKTEVVLLRHLNWK